MIVVIADDFSGASEIAGIGWRYGLSTEVQLTFNAESNADLLVVDADTRSQNKKQAIERTNDLAKKIKNCGRPVALFKKVDSVFRGYIVEEINALQNYFHFNRILLLPANPARGRKIISGHYLVNGIALDKTIFASDPHFPAVSSSIEKIIAASHAILPHVHLRQTDILPNNQLITGDIISKEDIKTYLAQASDADLCCGGAECFEAYLEKKNYSTYQEGITEAKFSWPRYTLIISGSTVKDQFEKTLLENHFFPILPLPVQWQNGQFVLERIQEENWQAEAFRLLEKHRLIAVAIDQEVKKINNMPPNFSNYFARLINYLAEKLGKENIYLAITGGATAQDIIKKEGVAFKIQQEIAPGIVTLAGEESKQLFTVKPGSYLWPSEFIKTFLTNNEEQTNFRN